MAKKKNPSKLEQWFSAPPEEISKRTTQFAKGYMAHKLEAHESKADPLFAHHEYMEQAELRADQIKDIHKNG